MVTWQWFHTRDKTACAVIWCISILFSSIIIVSSKMMVMITVVMVMIAIIHAFEYETSM